MTPRVLWLIKGLNRGGAEQLLAEMAPRMEGYEISVAHVMRGSDALAPRLHRAGILTHCLEGRHNAEPGWPARLRRLLRDQRYDLVHTHSPASAAIARVLAPPITRLVHTEHNLWTSYRRPTRVANALTYSRNDLAIAVSEAVRHSIEAPSWPGLRPPPRVEVLYHGIDPATVVPAYEGRSRARSSLGIDREAVVLGTVGSLTDQKDHAGVLDAFVPIARDWPDALLLVVGAGPLEAELRGRVSSRGLQGRVRFLGDRDDVAHILPALDVFVLGSRYEGLGMALVEAMATGLACVATRVGAVPEVITDQVDGCLVPSGSPLVMADAIDSLLRDSARRLRLGTAAADRVAAGFVIDETIERLRDLYRRVL